MSSQQENLTTKTSCLPNESNWWEKFVKEKYPDEKCLTYFKCSRKTYMYLIETLKPHIALKVGMMEEENDIYLRKGLCVDKQLAILLHKLTTNADYVIMSKKFNTHKTTIHKIIYKTVGAINKHLLHAIVSMPKNSEAEIITHAFEYEYKIPQIIGVMSTVHIPISSPMNLNYKFLNSKLYPSFVLQTVVDSTNVFRDVSVRHAGATEFDQVLNESNLNKCSKKVMPSETVTIDGVDVSYKIVSPLPGPLRSWLLSDYKPETSPKQILFNKCLKELRKYSDTVIWRLRARFIILSQMMDLSYKIAPQVIAACCIIHNICEKEGDIFHDEWFEQSLESIKKYPQPEMEYELNEINQEDLKQRDVLSDYVKSQEYSIEIDPTF